jgi:hypothetical protein
MRTNLPVSHLTRRRRCAGAVLAAGILVGTGGLAALAQANGARLMMNGKIASSRVRVIGSEAYVPVSDVAAALGGKVAKQGDLYEIRGSGGIPSPTRPAAAGGSQQVKAGTTGKAGDDLFDGKTRLRVLSVRETDSYTEKFNQEPRTYQPADAGDKLVVVTCLLKNGTSKKRAYATAHFEPNNTALADQDGRAYPPIGYDMRLDGGRFAGAFASPEVLPSAALDVALVFSVPKDTRIKDLIFSVSPAAGEQKPSDFRVSLADSPTP